MKKIYLIALLISPSFVVRAEHTSVFEMQNYPVANYSQAHNVNTCDDNTWTKLTAHKYSYNLKSQEQDREECREYEYFENGNIKSIKINETCYMRKVSGTENLQNDKNKSIDLRSIITGVAASFLFRNF